MISLYNCHFKSSKCFNLLTAFWGFCRCFFNTETHRIGQMDDSTWLLGNINQTGYFRVNYDLQNWKRLIQQLHSNPNVNPPCLSAPLFSHFFTNLTTKSTHFLLFSFVLFGVFFRLFLLETEQVSSMMPST